MTKTITECSNKKRIKFRPIPGWKAEKRKAKEQLIKKVYDGL